MPSHIRSLTALALLSFLPLTAVGCSQSGPAGSEHGAAPAQDSQPDSAVAQQEEMPAEPADDAGVKLATAESPLRSANESAKAPAGKDPAAPAELPRALPPAEAPLPHDNVETADLTMAEVKLTDHHKAMCLVKVGEQFPEMKLPDIAGQAKPLAELFGEKLTLVVFWNSSEPTSLEQLADLMRFHQPRFGEQGLAIVAINTGDPAPQAAELAKKSGATFAVLTDADGAAFKQVATAKLPRTYLLDKSGKILWFDMEYSATTRRDMVQAIRFSLAHQ